MTYILRAYDRAGDVGFYTGKAGPEWVNNQTANAFVFESIDVALRRLSQFNKFEPVHRLMFRVENLEDEASSK